METIVIGQTVVKETDFDSCKLFILLRLAAQKRPQMPVSDAIEWAKKTMNYTTEQAKASYDKWDSGIDDYIESSLKEIT